MKKILIVDDEFKMRHLLRLYLQQESYLVEDAADGRQACDKIIKDDYDLIILDVMMPLMDGWETLKHIRGISEVPVIMLTAKGSVQDKVTGLTMGADDYLVKPFEEEELMARVKALLRRAQPSNKDEEVLKYKGLILNLTAREITYQGNFINLTQTEFDLIKVLIEHKGNALSRELLVEFIWGIDFMGEDRTVDSHIKNLRDKLKAAGIDHSFVKTVWGIGYKVE
ncbi:response regulator transcription factor [Neobacillus niacini]|uniref:response regulator transcription factor n=1 Tax=Neobacillus niacini TaxID=86668 RepID=UPI002FFF85BD